MTLPRWTRAAGAALWPAYWLSGFVRRDPRLWVFGSHTGRSFTDNAKWLFLACARDARVRAVWLSRSAGLARHLRARGFRAAHVASLRGIAYGLRAGAYVFDDSAGALNLWFSRGARLVNLWHGVPLKRIEADIPRTSRFYRHFSPWSPRGLFQRVFQPYKMRPHDHLVATSRAIGNILASAFRMDPARVLVEGYPRNDALFRPEPEARREAAACLGETTFSRTIGYFPTFRERPGSEDVRWPWDRLDRALRGRNALLVIKQHPQDGTPIDCTGLQNIRVLPARFDPYPLLPLLDALVTDYSSIVFDYLLLDRPVLFFPYDLAHYQRDERGFYFDYGTVTPGPKASTFDELVARLCELLDGYDREHAAWREPRERVLRLCHEHRDGRSSERLIDALLERLRPPDASRERVSCPA